MPIVKDKVAATEVLLSLGANLGDREKTIRAALQLLEEKAIVFDLRASGLYETAPVGYTAQPDFLNMALSARSTLSATTLFEHCKDIETQLGRRQRRQWREREIDIDLLLYGADIIQTDRLALPHPRMHERRFVLAPAAEVASGMLHPLLQKTIGELLAVCRDRSLVQRIEG